MVGRNGIVFSGYKSHRTTEHRGGKKKKSHEQQRTKIHRAEQRKNRGSIQGERTKKHGGAEKQKPRKTEAEPEQKQSKEPEKAWVQPTPGSRTLTIVVFVQSRGIRKQRPKVFFLPKHNLKGEKGKQRRKEKRRSNHFAPAEKEQSKRQWSYTGKQKQTATAPSSSAPFSAAQVSFHSLHSIKSFKCSVKVI
jgi:hypothetical protein